MNPHFTLPARAQQGAIGLALALAIAGGWLAIHAWGMFVFEISWTNWPLALGVAMVQCWLSVGVFIVCHDAMHGSLVPGRARLNGAIGAVLLALYAGFAWKQLRDAHFAHHKLAGRAGDPDFDEHNPGDFARWYATFFRRYFGWRSILFVHTVVGIYWLVLGIPMAQIVLLYGLPALGSSLQLFYFGTFRPHCHRAGAADASFSDHHNTRSEDFGTLASLATCFHFGYHLEHHRRPDVPWWALPGARRAGVGPTGPAPPRPTPTPAPPRPGGRGPARAGRGWAAAGPPRPDRLKRCPHELARDCADRHVLADRDGDLRLGRAQVHHARLGLGLAPRPPRAA